MKHYTRDSFRGDATITTQPNSNIMYFAIKCVDQVLVIWQCGEQFSLRLFFRRLWFLCTKSNFNSNPAWFISARCAIHSYDVCCPIVVWFDRLKVVTRMKTGCSTFHSQSLQNGGQKSFECQSLVAAI